MVGVLIEKQPAHNKKYMTIAVTQAREPQLSALAPLAHGKWSARQSATAYTFNRQLVQKLPFIVNNLYSNKLTYVVIVIT